MFMNWSELSLRWQEACSIIFDFSSGEAVFGQGHLRMRSVSGKVVFWLGQIPVRLSQLKSFLWQGILLTNGILLVRSSSVEVIFRWDCLLVRLSSVEVLIYINIFLAQAACVRHACLRAPCVAWPLLSPSFSLSLSPLFPPSFAFDPLRGNSHVRNNFSPNILA